MTHFNSSARSFTGRPQVIICDAMEDPMPLRGNTALPLRELELRASRSSGPGGQHANVTASRIEASFDVAASSSLTDAEKQLIIDRLGPVVTAIAQDERSQARNRELALERLRGRLSAALFVAPPRRKTRPTKASERRRKQTKRRRGEIKRSRRPPATDSDG
jgi:ribosome-associated protein